MAAPIFDCETLPLAKVFRLREDGLGLTCNADGVFFGRSVPLLEAFVLPGGRKLFKPRTAGEVAMIFRSAYGEAYDGNPRMGGLRAAANARGRSQPGARHDRHGADESARSRR